MTERGLTFIDVDENRLELWLKQDRAQLVVIDSRPELEAGELRRFASVLFAEYVGTDLAARLGAAQARLQEAREIAGDELAAVLDGALQAIDGVAAAIKVPDQPALALALALAPEPRAEAEAELEASASPPEPQPVRSPQRRGQLLYLPFKKPRGKPAREASAPGWGWLKAASRDR